MTYWLLAEEEHDNNVKAFLDRCLELNLKLNAEKMKFKKNEVTYMGNVLCKNGLKADPLKVKAIMDMPEPKDAQGVRRLIGMVNYLAKFVNNLSSLTAPLRRLIVKNSEFKWDENHDKAFSMIKKGVSEAPVLQYYDTRKPVTIQADASQCGLGATLM